MVMWECTDSIMKTQPPPPKKKSPIIFITTCKWRKVAGVVPLCSSAGLSSLFYFPIHTAQSKQLTQAGFMIHVQLLLAEEVNLINAASEENPTCCISHNLVERTMNEGENRLNTDRICSVFIHAFVIRNHFLITWRSSVHLLFVYVSLAVWWQRTVPLFFLILAAGIWGTDSQVIQSATLIILEMKKELRWWAWQLTGTGGMR